MMREQYRERHQRIQRLLKLSVCRQLLEFVPIYDALRFQSVRDQVSENVSHGEPPSQNGFPFFFDTYLYVIIRRWETSFLNS